MHRRILSPADKILHSSHTNCRPPPARRTCCTASPAERTGISRSGSGPRCGGKCLQHCVLRRRQRFRLLRRRRLRGGLQDRPLSGEISLDCTDPCYRAALSRVEQRSIGCWPNIAVALIDPASHRGAWRSFLLDIPFHRMSDMACDNNS
jgi:hypothetical protein